ncbi:MAG TPA: hypothetical protein VFR84_13265 [Candidatus Angelobacter sp.]|nr:hypothetical protein [Candidatus Angelobacter sp.]
MAYEITFAAKAAIPDRGIYINDCCWGGDVIRDRLLPILRRRHDDIQTNQEDWGWFIWMDRRPYWIAIDIMCNDKESGEFLIHISATYRKWFWSKAVELEEVRLLKEIVVKALAEFGTVTRTQRFSPDFRYELADEP